LEIADVYFRICGGLKASKVQRSSAFSSFNRVPLKRRAAIF